MNKKELLAKLSVHGCIASTDRRLGLTSKIIRGTINGQSVVAVGGDEQAETQINAFQDAVYRHNLEGGAGAARFILGRGSVTDDVLWAIATLEHALLKRVRIDVEVDFEHHDLTYPRFLREKDWLAHLQAREGMEPSELARRLSTLANVDSFRWYRSVTKNAEWSGRIDGLQICDVPHSANGPLVMRVGNLGKEGAESVARRRFKELAGLETFLVDESTIDHAAQILRKIADDRKMGRLARCLREHRLEAMLLRGAMALSVDGKVLQPIVKNYPFQFPTLWSDADHATPRYVDVLMGNGEIPWVVELKADSNGKGQHYRHAIGQSVLYREFIRRARWLHPWFEKQNLDPAKCQAAIAFPTHRGDQRALLQLAAQFDVKVAMLSS